jgi:hypothetical protein
LSCEFVGYNGGPLLVPGNERLNPGKLSFVLAPEKVLPDPNVLPPKKSFRLKAEATSM